MGCGSSAPKHAQGKAAAKPSSGAAAAAAAERKKKLDPKDYLISKRVGEAIVKQEGVIAGEQFNIEDCKNCDIFLMDYIATAFVDECEGCRIFIGPTESSVMVRNCKSCDFIIACQQFRSRDCEKCKLALFCTTEPIIETSTNMQFACFDFGYFSLRRQIQQAGLKLWNNKWSQVYDFNKNNDKSNWSFFPQDEVRRLLRPGACEGGITPEELEMDQVVPVTLGNRPWPFKESSLICVLPDSEAYVEALLSKVTTTEGWILTRTRSMLLSKDQLTTLFAWAKEPKLATQCKGREVTGIEICGTGIQRQVEDALRTTGLAAGSKSIRLVPEGEAKTLGKAFFEVWKDEI
mmetsp:Transcript_92805/g.199025  ORF Transcript_92805/g.199025 Transcript_92805/m.199025 type:complete len:348 (+) Transcript_92805:115-1158(+)